MKHNATNNTTRKAQAVRIYTDLIPVVTPSRQAVITELVNKLGMTKSGASTYYANMKTGKWAITISPVGRGNSKATTRTLN